MSKIKQSSIDKVINAADIVDVIQLQSTITLKKSGASYKGDCPRCGGKGKFSVNPVKQVFGCFSASCDLGSHKGAINFLIEVEDKNFVEAIEILSKQYNIELEYENETEQGQSDKKSFRDLQLLASGIPYDYQKYKLFDNKRTVKYADRYEKATIDMFGKIKPGDDMILNYLGLDNKPMTYRNEKGTELPFFRIRFQNPALHKTKDGKEIKYKSPYKSGSHLWLPNKIIQDYAEGKTFETLYITEGEKKSDKMCLHNMPTVGVGGIHNFSYEGMTSTFEQIIKKCEVKNIVFVLDSDCFNISKNDENADYRAKTFANAVLKFRDYFYAYKNNDIDLNLYFGYGKDKVLKGIDDVLVRGMQGNENALKEDFDKARIDREGKGEYVNVHQITLTHPNKIYDFWHLNTALDFINHHKEELQGRKEFKVKGHRWAFNAETKEPEMIEKILDHEKYWDKEEIELRSGKTKVIYNFNYYNSLKFLQNRGFGLYDLGANKFRMVKAEGRVIKEIDHHYIQQYVKNFTEDLGEIAVLNMLLKGGTQYLGPHQLSQMYYINPAFIAPEQEAQYMIFEKKYWRITANDITEGPITELPKNVWHNKIISFDAELIPNFMNVKRVTLDDNSESWDFEASASCQKSDMFKFLAVTSDFWWEKEFEYKNTDDACKIVRKANPEAKTAQEMKEWGQHLICKMIAAGYLLHEYRNLAQLKAIICMDGLESEVGKSMGGSGKSIYSTMFEHILPSVVIDGKKKNLTEDPHIYDLVDERTAIITVDDCRANLDFEFFFSQITRGAEVNQKGMRRFKVTPKFVFSTNHAIRGNDDSTLRRQYLLSFSNFFNRHRTPQDYFGKLMFAEWEHDQWNLFYNLMAACIQTYLRFPDLNKYTIPQQDLQKRKLRQELGENFLEFADEYFDRREKDWNTLELTTCFRNIAVSKTKILSDYLDRNPNDKKWLTEKKMKELVKTYCVYKDLKYTPNAGNDGRLKINGKEYLIVADNEFTANGYERVG